MFVVPKSLLLLSESSLSTLSCDIYEAAVVLLLPPVGLLKLVRPAKRRIELVGNYVPADRSCACVSAVVGNGGRREITVGILLPESSKPEAPRLIPYRRQE